MRQGEKCPKCGEKMKRVGAKCRFNPKHRGRFATWVMPSYGGVGMWFCTECRERFLKSHAGRVFAHVEVMRKVPKWLRCTNRSCGHEEKVR